MSRRESARSTLERIPQASTLCFPVSRPVSGQIHWHRICWGLLERQAGFCVAAEELTGLFLQDAGKDTARILAAEACAPGNILH